MATLFRLNEAKIFPTANTKIIKASEAKELLKAYELVAAWKKHQLELEKKAELAYQKAKEEGYQAGINAGKLEYAEKILETVMSSIEYIEGLESTVVRVVSEAVRKVIGELDANERIVLIVRQALNVVRGEKKIIIRISPKDEKALRDSLASMLSFSADQQSFLEIQVDARLKRGDCLLESELGTVDASLELQLKALENAMNARVKS